MKLSTNLMRLKWFVEFLEAHQQTNVRADFVDGSAETGEDGHQISVQLAGIRLACDCPKSRKTGFLRY